MVSRRQRLRILATDTMECLWSTEELWARAYATTAKRKTLLYAGRIFSIHDSLPTNVLVRSSTTVPHPASIYSEIKALLAFSLWPRASRMWNGWVRGGRLSASMGRRWKNVKNRQENCYYYLSLRFSHLKFANDRVGCCGLKKGWTLMICNFWNGLENETLWIWNFFFNFSTFS